MSLQASLSQGGIKRSIFHPANALGKGFRQRL
jgi:hypothetical protein